MFVKFQSDRSILNSCHTFPGKPCGQVTGDIFAARSSPQKARACQYFTQISTGLARAGPICTQTSFEHAQNFFRVSCGYLHADVIAKHQQEACKSRNLLVYNPLKESRLTVDLWPSCISACHLRSYCELFTGKKRSLYWKLACIRSFLRTWGGVYEDVEDKLLPSC